MTTWDDVYAWELSHRARSVEERLRDPNLTARGVPSGWVDPEFDRRDLPPVPKALRVSVPASAPILALPVPLDPRQVRMLERLRLCTFSYASFEKRFIRQLGPTVSVKQAALLEVIAHRFRGQIGECLSIHCRAPAPVHLKGAKAQSGRFVAACKSESVCLLDLEEFVAIRGREQCPTCAVEHDRLASRADDSQLAQAVEKHRLASKRGGR